MDSLSISRAWDESKARIAADGRLFMPVALAFLVLPQTALGAFSPTMPTELSATFYVFLLVALIAALVAQLAIVRLAIPPESTVGSAIARAAGRLVPVLIAFVLVFLAAMLLAFALVFAVLATGVGAQTAAGGPPPLWAALLVLLLLFSVIAVFQLISPIAAAEEGGPLRLMSRAWSMAIPNYWRLAAFLLLVWVGMLFFWIAVQVTAGAVVAAAFGPPAYGSVGSVLVAFFGALVQAGWTIVTSVMLARIYLQLAGRESLDVTVPKSGT